MAQTFKRGDRVQWTGANPKYAADFQGTVVHVADSRVWVRFGGSGLPYEIMSAQELIYIGQGVA